MEAKNTTTDLNIVIAENFLVSSMGHPKNSGYQEFDSNWKEWDIYLDRQSCGIIAVDILHFRCGLWLGVPTSEEFPPDAPDADEQIIGYAKKLIDSIEAYLAKTGAFFSQI